MGRYLITEQPEAIRLFVFSEGLSGNRAASNDETIATPVTAKLCAEFIH